MGKASSVLASHYNSRCCHGIQNKENDILKEIEREKSILKAHAYHLSRSKFKSKSKSKRTRKRSVRNKQHHLAHPSSLQQSIPPTPIAAYVCEQVLSFENIPSRVTVKS